MLANYRKLPFAGYLEPVVMTGGPVAPAKLIIHRGKEKAKIYMCYSKYHLEGTSPSLLTGAREGNTATCIHLTIHLYWGRSSCFTEGVASVWTQRAKGEREQLPSQPDQLNYPR